MINISSKRKIKREVSLIKDFLTNMVNSLEDHELLEIYMKNNSRFYICKPDNVIPLAIRLIPFEEDMQAGYFIRPESSRIDQINNYILSHKVTFKDNEYIIEEELVSCKFFDDHIYLCTSGIGSKYEAYLPYNEICFFTKNHIENYSSEGSLLAIEYNKLMLELYTN